MKTIYTLIFSVAFATSTFAQHAPAWVKFSDPANTQNFDVTEVSVKTDTAGNIYTAASVLDTSVANGIPKILLVKYNPAGVEQWKVTYKDVDGDAAYAVALLVDAVGNSYVCGYGHTVSGNALDYMITKFDNTGTLAWASSIDGGTQNSDYVTAATFDAAGNIVLAGYGNSFGTNGDDILIASWQPSGTFNWSYTYNNSTSNDEDRAYSVASDLNNNIFVTGSSYNGTKKRDIITIKVNNQGTEQWVNLYDYTGNTYTDHGYGITTDALGNSYVTGNFGSGDGNAVLIKYDASGNKTMDIAYAGHDGPEGKKIMLDPNNNIIITGFDFTGQATQNDFLILKYSPLGALLWNTTFNTPNSGESIESFYDAAVDAFGNTYVTGAYDGPSAQDMQTIVVSPAGNVVWNAAYTNTFIIAGLDRSYAITLDKNRNIIIAGVSETRASSQDDISVVTIKYDAPQISGIQDIAIENANMSIYPNPSKGQLNVAISDDALIGATITVTNLIGEKVAEERVTALTQQVSLNNAAKGMYLVSITTDKASVSRKLIIE